MSIQNNLEVIRIDYEAAMVAVEFFHYLHRRCHCTGAWGLYQAGVLMGVAVVGKPPSYTLCERLFGKDESKNVGEFNRLWVHDSMPRNTESWFVARILRDCPYDALVSFADTEQGHVGYIYQATNWLYTGLSPRQKYFRVKGGENAGGTQYRRRERMSKARIIAEFGPGAVEEYYSSAKHRYVYILRRGKELRAKLRYQISEYPK